MKLVERGTLRVDMEQLFLRQSRVPATVGMDLHAALAGLTVSRERILKLLERYGAKTVKAVMKKTLDAGERALLEKLRDDPRRTLVGAHLHRGGHPRRYAAST